MKFWSSYTTFTSLAPYLSHRPALILSSKLRMSSFSTESDSPISITPASRLHGFNAPTVWHEFTPLANANGAVNLGQGFPDWEAPGFVKNAGKRAIDENQNQYCRSGGHPPLVKELSRTYTKSMNLGREVDPLTEITISVGATEGIFAILQSFINPGDEVVLLEPAFDVYMAQVQMAGGICKFVPLHPPSSSNPSWTLEMAEFEAAFTDKTKAVIVNTPHNPTGKVFSPAELGEIATVLKRHPNVLAIADEVYEHLVYENIDSGSNSNGGSIGGSSPATQLAHTHLASLPGMFDRTLTVSSSGKTFSITGWKVGWVVGPAPLINGVMLTNQWVQFSVSTNSQHAVSYALAEAERNGYYAKVNGDYDRKRRKLLDYLNRAGLRPTVPDGGFFIMADTSAVEIPPKYLEGSTPACPVMTRDWAFCRFLTVDVGVAAIPPSAFYCPDHKPLAATYARFAFCKTDEAIDEAGRRLLKYFGDSGK